MNNIDLYVFSGTGNTLRIAQSMSSVFSSSQITCKIMSISSSFDFQRIDLQHTIGLAFPIACFSTYPLVWDFINKLPETSTKTKMFIFSTFAGNDGQVCSQVFPVLRAKGYDLIGYEGFIMPNNFMLGRINKDKDATLCEISTKRAEQYAGELLANTARVKSDAYLRAAFYKIIFKLSFASGLLQKMFKVKVVSDKCSGCSICVDLCPVSNLSVVESKAVMGDNCQDCMRCIAFCPEQALKLHKSLPYRACSYHDFTAAFDK